MSEDDIPLGPIDWQDGTPGGVSGMVAVMFRALRLNSACNTTNLWIEVKECVKYQRYLT